MACWSSPAFLADRARLAIRLALFLATCGGTLLAMASDTTPPVAVTLQQNKQEIKLQPGQDVNLELPAQFGAGYTWRLDAKTSPKIKLVGKPQIKSSTDSTPGATELQLFHLRVHGSGKHILALDYVHPWEKDAVPAKTFQVTLIVSK
jgi:predicted secreted protein